MSNYRLSKDTTAHYTSMEELRAAWGKEPITKRTKDEEKLKKQRERFNKKHLCKACGKPLVIVKGTNVMSCTNPQCAGIKVEREDKEGNKYISYLLSYDVLNETGADIANNIFD